MKAFAVMKTILLLLLFSNNAFSQGVPTTAGKEFWLSFGNNYNLSTSVVALQVRIVASKATEVRLSFTNNATLNETFQLAAGQVYTHPLSTQQEDALYSNSTGTTNRSLYITSDEDVSVYAINLYQNSTDATNVLPVNNYGTEYFTLSHIPFDASDGYTIIASEPGTTTITNHNGATVTLSRGQVYSFYGNRVVAGAGEDLTGNKITSDKPIAMFTTSQGTRIPNDMGAVDCLFQQLAPVHSWGSTFLVPVTSGTYSGITRNRDHIRIVASQNGTTITQTGGTIVTGTGGASSLNNLNAGQFVELSINLASNGCYITANKPIAVASFLIGWTNFTSNVFSAFGDPAMAWIAPIEQNLTGAAIAPFFSAGTSVLDDNLHYALIVTPTATRNNTRVTVGTGSPQSLSGGTWRTNTASGYSFYTMNFSSTNKNATYYFENPAGFTILGYGFGPAESYYYMAAAAARDLTALFYINDISSSDADGMSFCNSTFDIRENTSFTLSSNPGFLTWSINDVVQTAAQDQLQWTTASLAAGTYKIKMVAVSSDGDTVEAESTIIVAGPITPGSIEDDQSISTGTTAAELESTAPASGGIGTITYQWQSSPNGTSWTDISGATGLNYSPGAPATTTHYRRAASSNSCGTAYSNHVQITVSAIGDDLITITVSNTNLCAGEEVTLSAFASSVTAPVFRWYDAPTGGMPLGTSQTFTPSPNLTVTTTFYVSVSGTGFPESTRKAIIITVTPRTTPDMIKLQ